MRVLLWTFILIFHLSSTLNAKTYYSFPQNIKIGEHKLFLNGSGVKTSTWFNIKVYYAVLYLREKTSDVKKVLSQKGPKRLHLRFLRNISKDHLIEGWKDAFTQSLSKKTQQKLQKLFDQFNSDLIDVSRQEDVILTFFDDRLEIEIEGKVKKTYRDSLFSQSFFSLWFIKPIDPRLKEELLN